MALQYRRSAEEEESSESDDDYIPPEHVEVEGDDSESGEADLEPSSGADTDLDVGKRKRKRRMRVKAKGGKKKAKVDDFSDNNDETTSNETLVYLPLKATSSSGTTVPSSAADNSSSATPSPCPASSSQSLSQESSLPSSLDNSAKVSHRSVEDAYRDVLSTSSYSGISQVPPAVAPAPPPVKSGLGSVLAKLSGKKKQSTLEKSQMEWKKYKATNDLDEELTQHNKGKGGFLDRQDFLQRANLREYEVQIRPAEKRSSNL